MTTKETKVILPSVFLLALLFGVVLYLGGPRRTWEVVWYGRRLPSYRNHALCREISLPIGTRQLQVVLGDPDYREANFLYFTAGPSFGGQIKATIDPSSGFVVQLDCGDNHKV